MDPLSLGSVSCRKSQRPSCRNAVAAASLLLPCCCCLHVLLLLLLSERPTLMKGPGSRKPCARPISTPRSRGETPVR